MPFLPPRPDASYNAMYSIFPYPKEPADLRKMSIPELKDTCNL